MESHIRIMATMPEMHTFFKKETCVRFMEIRDTRYSSGIILAYDDNFDDDVGLIDGLLDVFTFFDQKLDTLKKAVEAAHANARCTERRAA